MACGSVRITGLLYRSKQIIVVYRYDKTKIFIGIEQAACLYIPPKLHFYLTGGLYQLADTAAVVYYLGCIFGDGGRFCICEIFPSCSRYIHKTASRLVGKNFDVKLFS